MTKHSGKIKLSLIENAQDFLADAIGRTNNDKESSWKYAIISLGSAIELLMKSVLEEEHWSLLFEDVDSASLEHLGSGKFRSVDFETACARLHQIAKVKLSDRDKKCLDSIRDFRNRVIHFKVDLNIDQVMSIVARGIHIFLELYKAPHLKPRYDGSYEARVNKSLRDFDKYVRIKMISLRGQIDSSRRPEGSFKYCETCYQDAVVFDSEAADEVQCLYCKERESIEDLASRHSELPVEECPECGNETLAFVLYNNEEGEYVCVGCGFKSKSLEHCWECGTTFVAEEGEIICPDCLAYKLNKG